MRGGIGHPSYPIGKVTPDEDHHLTIVGDPDVREVGAVVLHPMGQLHRLEAGGGRRVDVAHPSLEGDPGDAVHSLRRHHLHGEGRAQDVLDGEVGLCSHGARRAGKQGDGERHDGGEEGEPVGKSAVHLDASQGCSGRSGSGCGVGSR
jgi:hypothetical protein